jgi:hypothetical protein
MFWIGAALAPIAGPIIGGVYASYHNQSILQDAAIGLVAGIGGVIVLYFLGGACAALDD